MLWCIMKLIYLDSKEEFVPSVYKKASMNLAVPIILINQFSHLSAPWRFRNVPNVLLIELDSELLPHSYLLDFQRQTIFDPRMKYIFIFDKFPKELNSSFAKVYMINSILVEKSTGKISTYNPYKHKDITKIDTSLIPIGTCAKLKHSIKLKNYKSFIWGAHNAYGWTIHAGNMKNNNGIEYELIGILSRHMKWTIYHDTYVGKLLFRSFSSDHKFDFMYGYLNLKFSAVVFYTQPFIYDAVNFFVKANDEISTSLYPVKIFTGIIWILLLLCVLSLALMTTIASMNSSPHENLKFSSLISRNVSLILSLILEQLNTVSLKYWSGAILMYLTIFFTFLIPNIYRGKLYFFLFSKGYVGTKLTNEDILNGPLICYSLELPTIKDKLPVNNFIESLTTVDCVKRTILGENGASLASETWARRNLDSFRSGSKNMLQKIQPPFSSTKCSFIFPREHPLYYHINKKMMHMFEQGIVEKVSSKYDDKRVQKEEHVRNKLNSEHVKAPFILWVIGISTSTLSFIFEKYLRRIRINIVPTKRLWETCYVGDIKI